MSKKRKLSDLASSLLNSITGYQSNANNTQDAIPPNTDGTAAATSSHSNPIMRDIELETGGTASGEVRIVDGDDTASQTRADQLILIFYNY